MDSPRQYTAQMLRREVAMYMLTEWEWLFPQIRDELHDLYGQDYSYLSYIQNILTNGSWGDVLVARILSFMWNIRVTIILQPTLYEVRIRHNEDLSRADVILLLSGNHYSAAGV